MDDLLGLGDSWQQQEQNELPRWKSSLMKVRDMSGDCPEYALPNREPQTITFQRRERLQLPQHGFWQITQGFILTCILAEDGTLIPVGIWSQGDLLGFPLVPQDALEVESITQVTVVPISTLTPDLWVHQSLNQVKQTQVLLTLRHGPVMQRIERLFMWLGSRFGERTETGMLINLRLTHQMIADFVGSTRVTTTRLLKQLQQEGFLAQTKSHFFYLYAPQKTSIRERCKLSIMLLDKAVDE